MTDSLYLCFSFWQQCCIYFMEVVPGGLYKSTLPAMDQNVTISPECVPFTAKCDVRVACKSQKLLYGTIPCKLQPNKPQSCSLFLQTGTVFCNCFQLFGHRKFEKTCGMTLQTWRTHSTFLLKGIFFFLGPQRWLSHNKLGNR